MGKLIFSKRVTEYQIANGNDAVKNTEITTDDDFKNIR